MLVLRARRRAPWFLSASITSRCGRREVMLAERNHGARLRALSTLGMPRDKTHFIAHRELVEPTVRNAVAVEIDLVAVGAQDETAILLGEKACDPTVVRHRVLLHLASPLANMIFEQPAGGIESVADRDVDVLMRMVFRGIAADGDLAAGNFKVDADPEQIALMAARVPAFDDDAARHNAIADSFQLLGPLAYARRDCVRGSHMPEGDLKRKLHRILPCCVGSNNNQRRPSRD